jgi:VanZ family protein
VVLSRRYAFLTVLYCAALFWLSSTANPIRFEPAFPGEDKLVHAGLYAGLALLVSLGTHRRIPPPNPFVRFWAPVVFASLYGVSDEFHQYFVPGRTPDIWDICADAAGALLMQVVLCGWVYTRHRMST